MTGGQSALALDVAAARGSAAAGATAGIAVLRAPGLVLAVPLADDEELRQHDALLDVIHKASGGKTVWRAMSAANGDGMHRNH